MPCSFFYLNPIIHQYCRMMRDQILESFSHRDFNIMVIGNKYDLIAETKTHTQVGRGNFIFKQKL